MSLVSIAVGLKRYVLVALVGLATAIVSGCGVAPGGTSGSQNPISAAAPGLHGRVFGAQQPISGGHVYLYAVSATTNAGPATSLLTTTGGYVTTDAGGGFNITGDYSCPAGAYVYLLSLGGNPGLGPNQSNAQIALAAGLGSCSALSASTFIQINELTTIATASAFAAFASSETNIGASDSSTLMLQTAFTNASAFVDTPTGVAKTTAPGNGTVPQAKIDTLGNIIAACVNSDGTGSPCSSLMSLANVSAGQPVDTFQAALNIAHHPAANVTALYNLAPPQGVFIPALNSAPVDWSLTVQYPATVTLSPGASSFVTGGQQSFTATVSGSSAPTFSYRWSTTAANGTLNEFGGAGLTGQTTYCSTSAQAAYISAGAALSVNVTDDVSVQAFSGTGCVAANALGTVMVVVTVTPTTANNVVPTLPVNSMQASTLVVPPGFSFAPNQLTVVDTLGQVTPAADGSFILPTYTYASQIAVVLTPSGNPIMLGWLDGTHPAISTGTTAEVLAYYALGGPYMFTLADREALEARIIGAPGLAALTQAISDEIVANPDALNQVNTVIKSALNTFFTSISGITPALSRSGASLLGGIRFSPSIGGGGGSGGTGILIQPGTQSGVYIEEASAINTADAVNDFRRRTHVFVERVSETDSGGVVTADPASITDFELAPVAGLSGGVAGTLADLYNAYWGNSAAAYLPITSDPFSIPIVGTAAKTTYKVTVVGAGVNTSTYALLTPAQANTQSQVAIVGFVTDALIPFMSNFLFGSGAIGAGAGTAFEDNWKNDLTNDFLSFVGSIPSLKTLIMKGDYPGAMSQVIDNIRQAGSIRTLLVNSLKQAAGSPFAAGLAVATQSISTFLNAAGGVLEIFDSAVMAADLAQSDAADQWIVINGGQKVTLSPASTTLSQLGNGAQNLTVALPGVTDTSGYSYFFTNTGNAGDITGSGSGTGKAFCSSSNIVTYSVHSSPILQTSVTDKILVQAFNSGACRAANAVGTSPTISVIVSPDAVTLTPQSSSIQQTAQQALTAGVSGATGTNYSFRYTLAGSLGAAPVGTISDGTTTTASVIACSTQTGVTYTPNPTPTVTQTVTDSVKVQAFRGSGCVATNSIGTSSVAGVTIAANGLLLTPRNVRLTQTSQQSYIATLNNQASGTTYMYQWTIAGSGGGTTLGSIAETGGSQTGNTFCSTFNGVSYTPNASPIISTPASDILSVEAFSGSCISANAVSGVISTQVTVIPSATSTNFPLTEPIFNVLQASDGNYYASGQSGGDCVSNTANGTSLPCGVIYRITKSGTQTVVHQFAPDQSEGLDPNFLTEGPDGLLYGITGDGVFFSVSLSGQFTVLSNPVLTPPVPTAQKLLLGSDGYFYAIGSPTGSIAITTPAPILRLGLDGQYETAYSVNQYPQPNCTFPGLSGIADFIEGADSNFYVLLSPNCPAPPDGNGGALVQLSRTGGQTVYVAPIEAFAEGSAGFRKLMVQAADGNFYYTTPNSGPIIQVTPFGQFNSVFQLPNPGKQYLLTQGLQLASDQNLYGAGEVVASSFNGPAPSPCDSTTGFGCGFEFQITTGGGYTNLYTFGGGLQGSYGDLPGNLDGAGQAEPGIQNDRGELVGGAVNLTGTPAGILYQLDNHLPPPIQLTFSQSATTVNQPVTLNWNVLNGFSLTAQQCYAFIQGGASGAGFWAGKQYGTASSSGYAGTATIKPTAIGTYTYALTCGGRESGFATLVVQ